MRILIIDDEAPVAEMLADAVADQGHESGVAHRGLDGLARIMEYPPDAVFLDIALPDIDGVEVLRRMRRAYPALPVVLVTGRGRPDQIAEAVRLGVTDVLTKPFLLTRLSEALTGSTPGIPS